MSITIVVGHKEVNVVFPSRFHDGEILDYSDPDHCKYVADLFEIAAQRFSSGDFLAQYAPGLFVSGKSSRVNGLEANARTSLLAYSRAVIKALRKAAMALKARITSIPIPLFTFDHLFEYDNAGERGLLLTNRRNL